MRVPGVARPSQPRAMKRSPHGTMELTETGDLWVAGRARCRFPRGPIRLSRLARAPRPLLISEGSQPRFSVLGVDYSEHAASRFKGGIVGWLEREGGMDPWTKALAGIAFSLEETGQVSEVISRPEGIFLVRYMAQQPAILRPFEAVSGDLDQQERQRLRSEAEAKFEADIGAKYPVRPLAPAPP